MKTARSRRFWTALTIFSLIGQVAWVVENMYLNVFIYKMFHASAADISLMVAASAVSATLTTVLMGALSDRVGKRKLFMSLGYILWGVSIFGFALLSTDGALHPGSTLLSGASMGVTLTIALDCLMTFFGSTANDAAFNAWLTDSTDQTNRGAAEGVNAMMPLMAILVVFGGFMFFDLDQGRSWTLIFSIIGTLVALIGILGLFLIEEPKLTPSDKPYLAGVIYGFCPSTVAKNPIFYLSLLAFVVFNISIQIFMPYLILYYEVSLGMANYVLIMAPAILLAAVATLFFGKWYDKRGFTKTGVVSLLLLLCGYVLLFFTHTTLPVFVGSLLMMSGYLSGMAVFGAMIRDNTPAGKAGMLQGVRIFSQVLLPGLIGPFIGKSVLSDAELIVNSDGTTSFIPNRSIFLAALIAAVFVLPFFLIIAKAKGPRLVELTTPYEQDRDMDAQPYADYPRPQLRRDSYVCLNGAWTLELERKGRVSSLGSICVPFVPESRLSGIGRRTKKGDILIYRRTFTLPADFLKHSTQLHFGAVDQHAEVSLNGQPVGKSPAPYLPFSLDVTNALRPGENTLTVRITDALDHTLPWGKQRHRRGGMWYTPISGIWQTVWLESLPQSPVTGLRITPSLQGVHIEIEGAEGFKRLSYMDGDTQHVHVFDQSAIDITLKHPRLWTPDTPHLYPFTLTAGEDTVHSYFALRTVEIEQRGESSYICLNGKPYFFHGLLDQGYFSDGIFLPATAQGFRDDVARMKECGFNMLRKHIKLEPELFYYECDRQGMLVFQDLINSGDYHFLTDTALPTVLSRRGLTHTATPARRQAFIDTSDGIVRALYNHPCVVYYTIFNEGWGQVDADAMYDRFKSLAPSRIWDATSGWFKQQRSDVESDHIYFKPVRLEKQPGRPAVLSEFGGYSCKIDGHAFNLDKTYGYRFFKSPEQLQEALLALYREQILPAIRQGLCATVLTPLSDVEDETNGLLTYDRAILKVRHEPMQKLAERMREAFEKRNF